MLEGAGAFFLTAPGTAAGVAAEGAGGAAVSPLGIARRHKRGPGGGLPRLRLGFRGDLCSPLFQSLEISAIGFVVQVTIDHGLEITDLSLSRLGEDRLIGFRLPVSGVVLELFETLGKLIARGKP